MEKQKSSMNTQYPLPDFDLAPLKGFRPNMFIATEYEKKKLNSFILALALIYNDLKNILWVNDLIAAGQQSDNRITPYLGQQAGMKIWALRYAISIIHELLKLIEGERDVVASADFIRCLNTLNAKIRKDWEDICQHSSLASGKRKTRLGSFVQRIRDNSGFHYYGTNNQYAGYELWQHSSGEHAKFAYVSLGTNMAETRFYFADAASQYQVKKLGEEFDVKDDQISNVTFQISIVLRVIIENYILKILKEHPLN